MLKINDIVFVQNKGICKIENITKNAFDGADKNKEYFVMKPLDSANNMMIYFPTDTKVNIRLLTTKTKANSLLKNINQLEELKIENEETRFEKYSEVSKNGGLEDWLKLLKTLFIRKEKSNKKQFNMQEQKYINTILSCATNEMSYVLNVSKEEVENKLCENFTNNS